MIVPTIFSLLVAFLGQSEGAKLFYVKSTVYPFDQYRPWKKGRLSERIGYGCAVSKEAILVPAHLVADSTSVQVRCESVNELIEAKVVAVDYDCDLALLSPALPTSLKLEPVRFEAIFQKGARVSFERLSKDNRKETGRGELDQALVLPSRLSGFKFLTFLVKNATESFSQGELCVLGKVALGIAAESEGRTVKVIPAEVINHFIEDASCARYAGFPKEGFASEELLDPAMRRFLKIPERVKNGVYVSDVYTIGTGSEVLRQADVILEIDGTEIDAYGRYEDPLYGKILYTNLLRRKKVGEYIELRIWRKGKEKLVGCEA
ncbi:MAG: hypothetical protein DRI26_07515, partial [Chloroflexi bacterium]